MKIKNILKTTLTIAFLTLYLLPQMTTKVYAAGGCNLWLNDLHEVGVGDAIDCIASSVFSLMAKIALGLAIVFTLFTIFKTFISQGNPEALKEIPIRWKYTLLLIIVAGGGGAIISIVLKFLGFPTFSDMWSNTWGPFITFLNAPFKK